MWWLSLHRLAWYVFNEHVSLEDNPTYRQLVNRPMTLPEAARGDDASDVMQRAFLVFANALAFNPPSHPVRAYALELRARCADALCSAGFERTAIDASIAVATRAQPPCIGGDGAASGAAGKGPMRAPTKAAAASQEPPRGPIASAAATAARATAATLVGAPRTPADDEDPWRSSEQKARDKEIATINKQKKKKKKKKKKKSPSAESTTAVLPRVGAAAAAVLKEELGLRDVGARGSTPQGAVVTIEVDDDGGAMAATAPAGSTMAPPRPNPGAPVPPLVPSAKIFKWRLVFFSLFYIRKVKLF